MACLKSAKWQNSNKFQAEGKAHAEYGPCDGFQIIIRLIFIQEGSWKDCNTFQLPLLFFGLNEAKLGTMHRFIVRVLYLYFEKQGSFVGAAC